MLPESDAMNTPEIEQRGAPAPHTSRWYVKMPPRTVVLSLEQLDVAFRQGLIDSRTLVANDAVPTWTSLGTLANPPEAAAKPRREPITETRRRAFAPATESAIGPERGPAQASPSQLPVPACGFAPSAELKPQSPRLAAVFQDWRAAALAVLLALATLPVGYGMLRSSSALEDGSPQQLLSVQPRLAAAPLHEPQPSALIRENRTSALAVEQLPIVRASALPLAPARQQRQQRQHTRPRRSQLARSDRPVTETWNEALARSTR
jgi:hypothetical protein